MGFVHSQYPLLAEGFAHGTNPDTKIGEDVFISPDLLASVIANTNRLGGCPVDVNHDRVPRNGNLLPDLALDQRGRWNRKWAVGTLAIEDPDLAAAAESGTYHAVSLDIDFDAAKGGHYAKFASLLTKDHHPAIVGMPPLGTVPIDPPSGLFTAGAVQFSQAASAALQQGVAQETPPMAGSPDANQGGAPPDLAVLLSTPEGRKAIEAEAQKAVAPVLAEFEEMKAQFATAKAEAETAKKDAADAQQFIAAQRKQGDLAWAQGVINVLLSSGKITPPVAKTPGLADALVALKANQPVTVQLSAPDGTPKVDDKGQPVVLAKSPIEIVLDAFGNLPQVHGGPSLMQLSSAQAAEMQGGDSPVISPYGQSLGVTAEQIEQVDEPVSMMGEGGRS